MDSITCQAVTIGNIPALRIKNHSAHATVLLQGAQVIDFQAATKKPLLWKNADATFELGCAVRQGIPICWPWFGALEKNPQAVQYIASKITDTPAHGFARDKLWTHINTEQNEKETRITLALEDLPANFPLRAELEIVISESLTLHLTTLNHSADEHHFSEALHTYFAINHIQNVSVEGLDQCPYIDALDDWAQKTQQGNITFNQETDRIYLDTPDIITIKEAPSDKPIRIETIGSRSSIVWNPWIDKAERMSQFPAKAYQSMLCVESANADKDAIRLAPGECHTLSVTLSN